jgi:hypothetical protein
MIHFQKPLNDYQVDMLSIIIADEKQRAVFYWIRSLKRKDIKPILPPTAAKLWPFWRNHQLT